MNPQNFWESVFFATVRISNLNDAGAGASIGTGFLIRVPISADDTITFLVSNRHVFTENALVLTVHKRAEDGQSAALGKGLSVRITDVQGSLFFHPDDAVDLACLNMSGIFQFTAETAGALYARFVGSEQVATFAEGLLRPGTPVWFIGYPAGLFDTANDLPILRNGIIASVPALDFSGRPEFLIDAQVFPGSSGSPVFADLGSHYKLIGVIARTMRSSGEVIGLGFVLRSTLVQELLNFAVERIREMQAKGSNEPSVSEEEVVFVEGEG